MNPTEAIERARLPSAEEFVIEKIAAGFGPPFRGEIWEDDAEIGLSQDDAHGNKPFELTTCFYWKKPLTDANDPGTHVMAITAANQIGKTLTCEMIARHKIKHDPDNLIFYDQTIESSRDHMKTRVLPFLKSIPAIGGMIAEVMANNRFDVTTDDIMLPGLVLRGRPLNEANTARITVRYLFIHDAYISERNGQLRNARKRLTAFLGRELLVVESQGGVILEGQPDDFTELVKETDDADLWVKCPFCDGPQNFTLKGWQPKRADDFKARLPRAKVLEILTRHGCEEQIEDVMQGQPAFERRGRREGKRRGPPEGERLR